MSSTQPVKAYKPPPKDSDQQIFYALGESSDDDLTSQQKYCKYMLYGASGKGKTVLAAQIAQVITPSDLSIAYIDSYEGWVSLSNHKNQGLLDRTRRFRYLGYSQLEILAHAIKNKLRDPNKGIDYGSIGTVIFDEASTMVDMDTAMLVRHRASQDSDKDPDTPTWPDQNTSIRRTMNMLSPFYRLPIHVILVAHYREDKINTLSKLSPFFLPKAQPRIKEPLHLVGYVEATSAHSSQDQEARYTRFVQVHPTATIDAKCRLPITEVRIDPKYLIEVSRQFAAQTLPEVPEITTPIPDPMTDPGINIGE